MYGSETRNDIFSCERFVMKILAVDTSASSCGVAIADKETLLADLINEAGETHSKHLMDMIKRAFEISRLKPFDMDGFSVT
ncbi:MAG: hypothetical protein Q8M56_03605, partial [Desulfobacterales bacterium]|nr:hypothetical protein [Desulfobacterales bacterium]